MAAGRRRRLRRSLVKLVTGLLTVYLMSNRSSATKTIRSSSHMFKSFLRNMTSSNPPTEYFTDEHEARGQVHHFDIRSFVSRAAIALVTMLAAAKTAEWRRRARHAERRKKAGDASPRVVKSYSSTIAKSREETKAKTRSHERKRDLPTEATLRAHLEIYTSNLARALELKGTRGDLTKEEHQILSKKFEEMRETICMTEDLLEHVRQQR